MESFLFFPEKLRARAKLLEECDAEIDTFDYDADVLKSYRGETGEFYPLLPESEAKTFDLDGSVGKVYAKDNKIVMEFSKIAAPVHVEFEPGRMMRFIEFNVSAEKHDHSADWQEGLSVTHANGGAKIEIDRTFFRQWRIDDSMPYRFNLSSGSAALKPRSPWPYRLLVGTASAEEMLVLK